MSKTLKMMALGMTMGALGSMVSPALEAKAQTVSSRDICLLGCDSTWSQCMSKVGTNQNAVTVCNLGRMACQLDCALKGT